MSEGKHIRMIVAGGGTGGHIFPALAIAHALKRRFPLAEILFVGAKGKMEMEKVPAEGFPIKGLDIAGFDRSNWLNNIQLPIKLWKSFREAGRILTEFKPDVVVGVGGYASFPMLYKAQQRGIPTLIQEQNSFAGKSNVLLGKKAKAICVAWPSMEKFFPAERIVLTGNPVRKAVVEHPVSKEQAAAFFGLNPNQPIVFAFGGSLGAKSINETLAKQFPTLIEQQIQLVWQTGKLFYSQAQEAVKGREATIKVFDFIRDMNMAYGVGDVIISRAGASSISELCLIGKPVIFVPFPFAAEDHQTHNAASLSNRQAAILIPNQVVDEKLLPTVLALLNNPTQQTQMSQAIRTAGVADADERIVDTLLSILPNT
jgi:UDP-N-acetylglucosamine--N-acetylmuramyl-(pentapeptide) pyrophosphoryl-undecaprenol N-acetylglucosamine transferase